VARVCTALACCVANIAAAQIADSARYPVRPIRIVTFGLPGSTSDVLGRPIAQKLTEAWGQPVLMDYRAGANGVIASDAVAKSAPDGYTLLMGTTGTHGINATLYAKLPYDTLTDFAPIARAGITNYVLVAHPSVPARNVKELVHLAKTRPGQIAWASGGSVTQLATELFKRMADVDLVIVPYKGSAPQALAVMSGEVSAMFGGIAVSAPQIKAGKLRSLAVSGTRRMQVMPDVPTVAESGVPGFEAGSWYGLLAPAATSRSIVARLNSEVLRILQMPDVRERFTSEAFDVPADTPQQFTAYIKADLEKWAKVVKEAGIKPN